MNADYVLGVDYGSQRVGLALAHRIAQLPRPHVTLVSDASLLTHIADTVVQEHVGLVVVGVPRNMDGTTSEQSAACEAFARELKRCVAVPVQTVDETLSSVEAESRLKTQRRGYEKGDVDALAASIMLERYFMEQPSMGQSA
jgi:putative Holliday junction resolvase